MNSASSLIISGGIASEINFQSTEEHNSLLQFDTKLKTSKTGKTLPKSIFHKFSEDMYLCPVTCLNQYLARSQDGRTVQDNGLVHPNQVLLSHIKPHEPVSKPSIARWIKEVLKISGINIDIYKAHSTRSASTSKAGTLGVRIEDIIDQANWSNKSTFEKFYRKPIDSRGREFQHKILNS